MSTLKAWRLLINSLFVLALTVALPGTTKCLAASDVKAAEEQKAEHPGTVRIKAGSDKEFKDHEGNAWMPDQGFEGGETISRADDLKIENTEDPGLYRCERYSMTSFSHDVPNGKYKVKLYFAETYDDITGEGQRVFTFAVGDKEFKDFDVFKKAGGAKKAYIETVDVEVKDGKLKITFTPNVQNPFINAIEIEPAGE